MNYKELHTLLTDFNQYVTSIFNKKDVTDDSPEEFLQDALKMFLEFRRQDPLAPPAGRRIESMMVLGGTHEDGHPRVWGELNGKSFEAIRIGDDAANYWKCPERDELTPEYQRRFDTFCGAGWIVFGAKLIFDSRH